MNWWNKKVVSCVRTIKKEGWLFFDDPNWEDAGQALLGVGIMIMGSNPAVIIIGGEYYLVGNLLKHYKEEDDDCPVYL